MTRISLAERGAQIKRKLEAGAFVPPAEAMMNSGLRRTPEKVQLLKRLRDEAARQGRVLPFAARF